MEPNCLEVRRAAFRSMLYRCGLIPEEDSAIEGVVGILVTVYLLGLETELCERVKGISEDDGACLFRRSEISPISKDKQSYRVKTVAIILDIACYFDEVFESEEMVGLLILLASLAIDDSENELWRIAEKLVTEASQSDPALWLLLEREFPQLCRLIEEEAN